MAERKPVTQISDRAKRYRANVRPPPLPANCGFCGQPRNTEVHHIDGDESHGEPYNLMWACRSCNVLVGAVLRRAGLSRLTQQFNGGGGIRSLGQYRRVAAELRGSQPAGRDDIRVGVAMLQDTSPQLRSRFAQDLWETRTLRNPAARGAQSLAQWAWATNVICRHRDAARGECRPSSDPLVLAAVEMIRHTPPSRRKEFAAQAAAGRGRYPRYRAEEVPF